MPVKLCGLIDEEQNMAENYFFVMPKYKMTLKEYMIELKDEPITKVLTILEVTKQLIVSLKMVHLSGYVYNDLKPDNVAIDFGDGNDNPVATLIDLGLATKFKYPDGIHLQSTEMS